MFGRKKKNRSTMRVPTFETAEILDINGSAVQHCTVREISRTGAYIVPDNPKTLPKVCEIWIPHLNISVKAIVRWSKKGGAGLEFEKPIAASLFFAADKV